MESSNLEAEVWKDVFEYEGIYQVSNLGRVKSLDRITPHGRKRKEKVLKPANSTYLFVYLCKNNIKTKKTIHRIVAKTFIRNTFNKPVVNHINGIKTDNRVENLEWCTAKENVAHAVKMGLVRDQYGEKNNMCKLTKDDIIDIKTRISNGESTYRIHKNCYPHLGMQTLYAIKQGRNWNHIKI